MHTFFYVAIGGMAGAVTRFLVLQLTHDIYHRTGFPWGTMVVNLAGSLLVGILLALSLKFTFLSRNHAGFYLCVTGFLGAFTTFSTLSQDNMILLFDKQYAAFTINIFIHIILGIALAIAGFVITRKFI